VIDANPEQMIVRTTNALGHGMMTDLRHVVLVDPQTFSFANNSLIAEEIARINCNFVARDENYILVGPGRWGSADEALGIPVKWSSISAARIIVEVALQGMSIEPSQGTHFFQNLTSFGVGYFTVNNADDGSFCDMDFLNSCAVAHQGQFVKVIRFEEPLQVAMNGQTGLGVILKPQ
ncbi:MAG: phosphoenolpyruvate synthase, partial [Muribaculaceae bacterium]|nr:phosphoenolpyruvate synthase [Muribaculaceae bacterium]